MADLAELAQRFMHNERATDRLGGDLLALEEQVEDAEVAIRGEFRKVRDQLLSATAATANMAIAADAVLRVEIDVLRSEAANTAAEVDQIRAQVNALIAGCAGLVEMQARALRDARRDYFELLHFIGDAATQASAATLKGFAQATGQEISEEAITEIGSQIGFGLLESARRLSGFVSAETIAQEAPDAAAVPVAPESSVIH